MNILAVVPARGGSKGLPGKNIKPLHGISLTARAVLTALQYPEITDIVISTDDPEIALEAEKNGAKNFFLRPAELSTDTAVAHDVWIHAWQESEKSLSKKYDLSVWLEPTSPLRRVEDISACLNELTKSDQHEAAATVSKTPGSYTPHKTLTIQDGTIGFYLENGGSFSLRQTIPSYYHRNGICYANRRDNLLNKRNIIENNCAPIVIDRPIANIDSQEDFDMAEFLIQKYGDPLK